MTTKYTNQPNVDTLAALCQEYGIPVADGDGILLLRFTRGGEVLPHVLKVELMTVGRLDSNLMPIYQAIDAAQQQKRNAELRSNHNATVG